MWHFAHSELKSIGMRGIFAGFRVSLLKDSCGFGLFFATFEYVKSQGYQAFLKQRYGSTALSEMKSQPSSSSVKLHFGIEPMFLFLAGVSAAIAQQIVFHPLSKVQALHHVMSEQANYSHIMNQCRKELTVPACRQTQPAYATLRRFFYIYYQTFAQCRIMASKSDTKGLLRWLYHVFLMSTFRQIPSTSTGLVVFELLRRRYGIVDHKVIAA